MRIVYVRVEAITKAKVAHGILNMRRWPRMHPRLKVEAVVDVGEGCLQLGAAM